MLKIESLDHLVLTVASIDQSVAFYTTVLGMTVQRFGSQDVPRIALAFGRQKINLHQLDRIPDANVLKPMPGTADFCLITAQTIEEVVAHLAACGVPVIEGPVIRTGAVGKIQSVYVRDPDLNLVEIARYLNASGT
jgi:catechol 2,3-dioxygenase-like lactoylglutathione lyase family enzyme